MFFDTPHRYDQALDPSALTTVRTTLHAIEQGIVDCRNAGVDPDTDPAVVLLARHLAIVSSNQASDEVLLAACRRDRAAVRRFPALLILAIAGVSYDTAAKDRFHTDAMKALRVLADELGIPKGGFEVTSWMGDRSQSGAVTLVAAGLSVTVRIGAPYEGREVSYRGRQGVAEQSPRYAPMRALLDPTRLAKRIAASSAHRQARTVTPTTVERA